MTKFRTNHTRSDSAGGGMIVKVGLFVGILGALFFLFNRFSGGEGSFDDAMEKAGQVLNNSEPADQTKSNAYDFYPSSSTGEVIERLHYTFSYSEEHEQAEWVAYELTKESIQMPNVDRTGDFRPDPKIRKASASPRDYKGSGYDRGHLVPAGDMAFSVEAMSETFYMTNISPQIKNFNGGIWRELEENVRDWAYRFNSVYVVTGPVLSKGIREKIGSNGVSVPDEYFKVILDVREPEIKGIAFIIPNEVSYEPISKYAVSIDKVEQITGLDFFPRLMEEEFEELIESQLDISLWQFDDRKEQIRKESWNKRK